MEVNQKVKIYNTTLALKGVPGIYVSVHPEGYYELYMQFNGKRHNVLLPINGTVLVADEYVPDSEDFGGDIVR